ncbi:MAG: DUF4012 domain-containing protein [Frankia sp.]
MPSADVPATEEPSVDGSMRGGRPTGQRGLGHRGTLIGAVAGALVIASLGWVGVRGLLAARHLAAARSQISVLEGQILAGQTGSPAQVRASLARIQAETRAARRLTGDPVWSTLGGVPIVGCPIASASSIARVTDALTARALPPLATVSTALRPAQLRSGSTVNLAAFAGLTGPLDDARTHLASVVPRVRSAPTCGPVGRWLGLTAARDTVLTRSTTLLSDTDQAALAARLVPPMLGQTGTRRYLLVVTNDAESRATGGIIGGWGVLTASRGHLDLADVAGNSKLPGGQTQPTAAAALPPALIPMYGALEPTRVWANANLSPNYPTVNSFYSAMYKAGAGRTVDGTISVDPTTLAYLVAATRPAVLAGGQVVRAKDLVRLTESTVYSTIPDQSAREAFFASVGRAVYHAVSSGSGSTSDVLSALGRAAGEGRLLIASNHPDEEKLLTTTPLGGALPRAPGPYLAVVSQNASAGKLDYWLRRTTDYRLVRRSDGSADVTVTVRITNTAPAGLPYYVRQREDPGKPSLDNLAEQNALSLSIYTGVGSSYTGGTSDGRPAAFAVGLEDGHPVATTYVAVNRGATATVVLHVSEPVAGKVLTVRPQPMVTPEKITAHGIRLTTAWQPETDY